MMRKTFGILPSGEEVHSYTLKNDCAELEILTRGATIRRFVVFGRDIVGGFDTLDAYLEDTSHQGAVIGRVANRVANARFTMDGKEYAITENDNGNCLHGGIGFDYRVWSVLDCKSDEITLTYTSKDGEEGFPNEVTATVRYTLCGSALIIKYSATPSGKTPISLTNHAYFNLDGFGGTILNHTAKFYADTYTEVGDTLIPNGNRPSVEGTVFDLRDGKRIGNALDLGFDGYDHNMILAPSVFKCFDGKELGLGATVSNGDLELAVYTDQPGIQFYIGNFLGDGPSFKGGVPQVRHGALCLETQTEPNSINHGIGFYDEGEVYTHTCVYELSRKS